MLYLPRKVGHSEVDTSVAFARPPASGTSPTASWGGAMFSNHNVGSYPGSYTVIDVADYDSYGIKIEINSVSANATSNNGKMQIAISADGSTNWAPLVTDLIYGNAGGYNSNANLFSPIIHFLPFFIPAGWSIGVRAQVSSSKNYHVKVDWQYRSVSSLGLSLYSYSFTMGVSGVVGVAIVPGTSSRGSWVSLGTTPRDANYWIPSFQVASSDTAHQGWDYTLDLAWGDGSNKNIFAYNYVYSISANEATSNNTQNISSFIKAGSTIYARAQSATTTLDTYSVSLIGCGGGIA